MPVNDTRLLRLCTLLLTIIASIDSSADACTTAVISGKATVDGRPLLWKNRDAPARHNEVALLTEGPLRAIAVVNAGSRRSAWMGMNEAGFCIENSLSTDLRQPGKKTGFNNGTLIKRALQTCRTVADFKQLLEETNQTGRRTDANFGVIDAQGGAALFETGPTSFTMFDANDPAVAPHGYFVRSNFATTAHDFPANPTPEQLGKIYSAERYSQACSRLDLQKDKGITVDYLIRHLTRDLSQETGTPHPGTVNGSAAPLPATIATKNTISRTTTVSAAVFHGVKPGEDPRLATMWTILGNPSFSLAVPSWVDVQTIAEPLTDENGAALGEIAITLRDWNKTDDGNSISTQCLPGIWSDLWPVEDKILTLTSRFQQARKEHGYSVGAITRFHQKMADLAMTAMQQELREMKQAAITFPAPPPPTFAPVKKTIVIP
ncbi:carcinine hydrolase/isopenicillin-N N-acyltransferase family protein [Gimesia sp.]|uniref:carcinine hydrolase/isopenicillin-N N-acyltransferase family protein n=1 Tax=Gimesia sp. TaxID=2024833 RepID=UPI000C555C77|nr:carcinine hydrolase/isopenicillin-N N-acyltransferase family protein [Gimesia sp.]MAX36230.1 peptidase C45 [Gimesia sp.]HBL46799.1 peptidase C45 [Planctomycetaceae bacterium]|tara:strand:+ start:8438 stop:9739 length:1302 start_codon:yes stop_codon:yes gene_type:complete